jgi:hypothetical protein
MGAPISLPIITLQMHGIYQKDGNKTSYKIIGRSGGFRDFLGQKELKHGMSCLDSTPCLNPFLTGALRFGQPISVAYSKTLLRTSTVFLRSVEVPAVVHTT